MTRLNVIAVMAAVCVCMAPWSIVFPAMGRAEEPLAEVSLGVPRAEWILGEPVQLTVTVRSLSDRTIRAKRLFLEHIEPEIEVVVSEDGTAFRRYMTGAYLQHVNMNREFDVFAPREGKGYSLAVLYQSGGRHGLALSAPGEYWLRVSYPLVAVEPAATMRLESNTVQVTVREPRGADAEVWKKIGNVEWAYFLHFGKPLTSNDTIALDAVALLKSAEQGGYHTALRQALEQYYHSRRRTSTVPEQNPELKAIREALGLTLPAEGPFPNDHRLDVEITYHFSEPTALESVVAHVSQQSGVALSIAPVPELRKQRITSGAVKKSLRRFMRSLDDDRSTWVRNEDGSYILIPLAAPFPCPQP